MAAPDRSTFIRCASFRVSKALARPWMDRLDSEVSGHCGYPGGNEGMKPSLFKRRYYACAEIVENRIDEARQSADQIDDRHVDPIAIKPHVEVRQIGQGRCRFIMSARLGKRSLSYPSWKKAEQRFPLNLSSSASAFAFINPLPVTCRVPGYFRNLGPLPKILLSILPIACSSFPS